MRTRRSSQIKKLLVVLIAFFSASSAFARCVELEGQTNCDDTLTVGGKFGVGTPVPDAQQKIISLNAGTTTQMIQAASSPSADVSEWQDSTGANKVWIDSSFILHGNASGLSSVPISPGSTNYIQNTNTLQSGATVYVASGTVQSLNTTTLQLTNEFKPGLTSSTSGQFLVSQGAGFAPKFQWAGRVLNITSGTVVNTTTSTTVTATLVQSGIKASITPKETGSMIVVVAFIGRLTNSTAGANAYATIERNGTNLSAGGAAKAMTLGGASATVTVNSGATLFKIDNPNTSSLVTYEVYFKADGGTANLCGSDGGDCQVTLLEIGQ